MKNSTYLNINWHFEAEFLENLLLNFLKCWVGYLEIRRISTGSTITNWCFLFCSCIHIHRPRLLFRHLFFPVPMYNFGYLCKIIEFWLYIPIFRHFWIKHNFYHFDLFSCNEYFFLKLLASESPKIRQFSKSWTVLKFSKSYLSKFVWKIWVFLQF